MSNLERDPIEFVAACTAVADATAPVVRLLPRLVPLGGPRAMTVRRTLPQRGRSTIGAWCFIDHYGPDDVRQSGGMVVPPHPHTGLQTVSWLFEGEIEHRDSTGSHALVRPGELNLMTAGRGISHSEVSTPDTRLLHGVQLWLALPELVRQQAPHFENHVIPPLDLGGAAADRPGGTGGVSAFVFVGTLAGHRAAASVYSPLLGAQLDLPAGASIELEVDPGFEHGVLVDAGTVLVGDALLDRDELGYLEPGRRSIRLENGAAESARVLLLGGTPLGEQIVMWWNFIGRSHEEVVAFRTQWQSEVIEGTDAAGRFGAIPGFHGAPLPAPALPNVRLRPRD